MEKINIVNFIILGCLLFILIAYPIIIFVVIKRVYIPNMLGDVVDDSLDKVNQIIDLQLDRIDNSYISKYYDKAVEDLNIIVDKNIDKILDVFKNAEFKINFPTSTHESFLKNLY